VTIVLLFLIVFLVLWVFFALTIPLLKRFFRVVAHRTAAFRYSDYLPVVLLVAAAGLAASMAGDAFLDLAELVRGESPLLQRVDTEAHTWAATGRSTGATRFFVFVTIVGAPVPLALIVAAAAVPLVIKRRWQRLGYLLVTTIGGSLLVVQLKIYFARARPDLAEAIRQAHGFSFPSGHAMGSMVVSGALAYLGYRAFKSMRAKAAAVAAAATFVLAVALSRVYLGVHWISDVAAGMSGGLLWVTGTTVAYEVFRRIRLIRALRAKARSGV
jgi:undecaprenyl-diphosphatase